jgi:hypothetical protein
MKCPRCEFVGLEWDWIAKKPVTVTKKRNKKGYLSLGLKFIPTNQPTRTTVYGLWTDLYHDYPHLDRFLVE